MRRYRWGMKNSHSEPRTRNRTRAGRNEVPRSENGSVSKDRAWNSYGRERPGAEGGAEVEGPNLEHEAALGHCRLVISRTQAVGHTLQGGGREGELGAPGARTPEKRRQGAQWSGGALSLGLYNHVTARMGLSLQERGQGPSGACSCYLWVSPAFCSDSG